LCGIKVFVYGDNGITIQKYISGRCQEVIDVMLGIIGTVYYHRDFDRGVRHLQVYSTSIFFWPRGFYRRLRTKRLQYQKGSLMRYVLEKDFTPLFGRWTRKGDTLSVCE